VPDHLHYEIAKECIQAELHLMVVKPLTPTYAEGEELANAVNKANLHGVVEFHKRWDRSNLILKEKYTGGQLGELLYSLVEYSQRKSVPQKHFKSWADETSILQYLGVHYIDMMRFITEASPQRVSATGQKNYLLKNGIDTYDSIQCHVEWKTSDGKTFIQTLLTNWIDPEGTSAVSDQKIKIVGTKGRVEADQKDRGLMMVSDESMNEHINPYFSMSYTSQDSSKEWFGYGIDSITTFLRDISSIEQKEITPQMLKKIRPSFEEALISTAVIEAAHSSLKNNSKWVNVQNS
jgi:predicted dehydrogenase